MTLAEWLPPEKKTPSVIYPGEQNQAPIYTAVGDALSRWEHLESGLTRLFQLLCETPSHAAPRAYGTVDSCSSKAQMLRAAALIFFERHPPSDQQHAKDVKALIGAFEKGQELRNNIAHGMVIGYQIAQNRHGYFLRPPSGATKKIKREKPQHFESIAYFYGVEDISRCGERFTALLDEAMRLIQSINKKYAVLTNPEFHP